MEMGVLTALELGRTASILTSILFPGPEHRAQGYKRSRGWVKCTYEEWFLDQTGTKTHRLSTLSLADRGLTFSLKMSSRSQIGLFAACE